MPKRTGNGDNETRKTLAISVTQEERLMLEAAAIDNRQTISAFVMHAVAAYLAAPRFGGVPVPAASGFRILPTSFDDAEPLQAYCYIPVNWTPEDVRHAAEVFELLRKKD